MDCALSVPYVSSNEIVVRTQKIDKGSVGNEISLTKEERNHVSHSSKILMDEVEIKPIVGTRLSFLSHEEIKKIGIFECTIPEISGDGSPNDMRLGTLENNKFCSTCYKNAIDCPGHCGYIDLNRWFLHPKRAELAINVLMCVCNSCGKILTDESSLTFLGLMDLPIEQRIKEIAKTTAKIRCTNVVKCQFGIERRCIPNPTYYPVKAKDGYIVTCSYNDPREKGKVISTEKRITEIFQILSNIDSESLRVLGFVGKTHPKDFVMRSLLVIPPCARPYVVRDDGAISQDNITTAYIDIIRKNNVVGKRIHDFGEKTEVEKREAVRDLYFFISHMIDNSDGKYTRSKDEPMQSICQRVGEDKRCLVRGANMGKRNNFTGRSVLVSHNEVEFGYMTFPKVMCKTHTLPVKIADYNISQIIEMYKADCVVNLIRGNGKLKGECFSINERTKHRFTLKVGDIVEIMGKDGDETVFNRQPTLDKYSLMGYRAKYTNQPTFGVHSSCTTPHNADFDGDEGNKHKIQTLDARSEIRNIADVGSCIMNAKKSSPTMGLVYNTLTSGYLMTYKNVDVEEIYWNEACKYLKDTSHLESLPKRLRHYGFEMYKSRSLFSVLLPEDFYYNHAGLKIVHGIIVSGVVESKHIGPKQNSIIQVLWKFYGKERTIRFFTEAQWILDWYLEHSGFGINILDCFPPNMDSVHEMVLLEYEQTQNKINLLGAEKEDMSILEKEFHERQTINYLNSISRLGSKISSDTLTENNALNIMSRSGAKGKDSNMTQIIACLGQQYVKGKRPESKYSNNTRCLPYFEPNSLDIQAHGFISESFFTGTRPSGFIFHLMASRVGIMDTALTTADSGHMQHRMMKTLEDFKVSYDGSIRNANNIIMSYSYNDGFSGSELISTKTDECGEFYNFVDVKCLVEQLNSTVETY